MPLGAGASIDAQTPRAPVGLGDGNVAMVRISVYLSAQPGDMLNLVRAKSGSTQIGSSLQIHTHRASHVVYSGPRRVPLPLEPFISKKLQQVVGRHHDRGQLAPFVDMIAALDGPIDG